MKCLTVLIIILGSLFLFSGGISALDSCESEVSVSCEGMRITICPRRDFKYIRNACDGNSDYIEVWVRDQMGNGIANVPETDYCLYACDSNEELSICYFFITADSLTSDIPGFEGRTTFSNSRIAGGGCALNGVYMKVQGMIILDETCRQPICLDIEIVSPDINGDQRVDLSDLGIFGLAYNSSEGQPNFCGCCDYDDDGKCNLSDFAFFGQHYSHQCL